MSDAVQSLDRRRGRPSYPVEVVDADLVTPRMRRITFEGEGLAGVEAPLPAQWMKVVLAPPEAPVRPNRAYTIRHLDAKRGRVVMDFVLHGGDGLLSRWASRAQVGDRVYLGAPRGGHRIDAGARWRLLVGDETALPAIACILRMLPDDGVPVRAVVEVSSAGESQALQVPLNSIIEWLARDMARHGSVMEAAVAALSLPDVPGQAFLAGAAGAVRTIKLDIVHRCADVRMDAQGYWRLGAADHRD